MPDDFYSRGTPWAAHANTLFGRLEDVRDLDMDNAQGNLVSLSPEAWFGKYGGQVWQPELLSSIETRLRTSGVLSSDGWTSLAITQKKKRMSADQVYHALQGLAEDIANVAKAVDPSLVGKQITAWQSSGTVPGQSVVPGHLYKPDSRSILIPSMVPEEISRRQLQRQPPTPEWEMNMKRGKLINKLNAHCACIGEFKKGCSPGDTKQVSVMLSIQNGFGGSDEECRESRTRGRWFQVPPL